MQRLLDSAFLWPLAAIPRATTALGLLSLQSSSDAPLSVPLTDCRDDVAA